MRTQNVKIDADIYTLTAVTADVSGAICLDLIGEALPVLTSFFDKDFELLNIELRKSVNSKKLMRIIEELINPLILKKNGNVINDWKEEFACKPFTLYKLGIEALRFNCEDFFTFISGFVNEKTNGMSWSDIIQSLEKEGVEIDPLTSVLFKNGEEKTPQETTEK